MRHWLFLLQRLPHRPLLGLIAATVVVFLIQEVAGPAFSMTFGAIPQSIHQSWLQLSESGPSLAAIGRLLTLVTAVFLHGSIDHILFNLVFLWAFASLCSGLLGTWRVFYLFFLFGLCGNLAQTMLNQESQIPIIGASGAVLGFEGLYLGLALNWELRWPDVWPLARPIPPMQLGLFAVVGVIFDVVAVINRSGGGVAYGAHVGGFLCGLFVAFLITFLYRNKVDYEMGRRRF